MAERVTCEICGRRLPVHLTYIVKMDVYADPSIPDVSAEELATADLDSAMNELLDEMKAITASDLQDGVHRRFEYRLCPACQKKFLANPMGKPRSPRDTTN